MVLVVVAVAVILVQLQVVHNEILYKICIIRYNLYIYIVLNVE